MKASITASGSTFHQNRSPGGREDSQGKCTMWEPFSFNTEHTSSLIRLARVAGYRATRHCRARPRRVGGVCRVWASGRADLNARMAGRPAGREDSHGRGARGASTALLAAAMAGGIGGGGASGGAGSGLAAGTGLRSEERAGVSDRSARFGP